MIITADKNRTDTPAFEMLRQINTDIPILLISRSEQLDFNEEILSLEGKSYVIADYIEMGWDWDRQKTLIVGQNTDDFKDTCQNDGWSKLHDFIARNKPILYFKRELLISDQTNTILPIEYVNWQADAPRETYDKFNIRSISCFNYWGRSSESRLIAHGEFWKRAAQKGYSVCDNLYFLNTFLSEDSNPIKFVTMWMPHYFRVPITDLLSINGQSKLSLSLPGSGIKCFRNCGESFVNSVMVMPEDNLAWSYPFVHNVNCIKFPIGNNVKGVEPEWPIMETIEQALQNPNLYNIYLESQKAADWYRIDNYIKNYLEPIINSI